MQQTQFFASLVNRRRMLCLTSVGAAAPILQAIPARAQPIKPELLQATSVDAVMAMVGAGKPQNNGRLELEFSEIAARGPLEIRARSQIPGTVSMLVMVGAPNSWYGNGQAGSGPTRPPDPLNFKPTPVVLKAWQVPPGVKPEMRATYATFEQRQAFTLLAFAQGRWSIAVREAKLACVPGECAKRLVTVP